MDSQTSPKRRKLEDKNESSKQVDAHIKTFLESIFKNAGKNGASENAREALASVVSKTLSKRRRNVPRQDASTQTEEEDLENPFPERPQQLPSPTLLLTENAAAYYASVANNCGYFAPSNTDLQYYTTSSTNSTSTSQLPPTELRQQLSIWDQSYQRWFKESFGVDIESVPLETTNQQPNIPIDPDSSRAAACQTPVVVTSNPVISAQPVIYAAQPMISPLSALLNAQMAAQNLLSFYAQQQLKQQQQQFMAAAIVSSLTAIPRPIVCFPSSKSIQPQINSPAPSSSNEVPLDSSELSGHVTQYGAYGVLRSCSLDVMETQKGSDNKDIDDNGELPVYTTPEDYRIQLQTWMPPRPPLGLLLRKQTLICVITVPIQSKMYEIEVRKKAASKTPVKIDYVSALETIVEKNAKVKVTYVFNRINRLHSDSQPAFLQEFVEGDNDETVAPLENQPSTESPCHLVVTNSAESGVTEGQTVEPLSQAIYNPLDIEELSLNNNVEVKVTSACEERSKAMYICDLLIGDVLICQALADCKMQARICACREALYLLSKPTFVVGGIRTWYGSGESPIDYLTFCLSPEAKRVPRLTPYLADPLAPIPSEQPICPEDPAETFKVCTPKPIHDLWLYTARPIAVNVDEVLTPEQYLAQSAEFSQMTVNFEMEFDSSTGEFTAFGLVDAQRCVKASGKSVPVCRAAAASRLLQYLKLSQPVVGLLLPPPDPEDVDELEMVPDDSMNPLWGLTEASIVDSLMWGKHEKQFALPIEHLEAHCEILGTSSSDELDESFASAGSSFFHSRRLLDRYLEAYAASALVAPLRISLQALPHSLWHLARTTAHSWGLLTLIEFEIPDHLNTAFLLVCKRAPLPRLKRTLFEKTEVGVFYLLSKGNLPPESLRTISSEDLLESPTTPESQLINPIPESSPYIEAEDEAPYVDENDPLTRMARTFHATSSIVKAEATDAEESGAAEDSDIFLVSAELNQPSNAVEILDDLPKQLIPGIDF